MKVELLYFKGCPNWKATLSDIQAVLAERGMPQHVELVEIKTSAQAKRLRFIGSPTVRVNGVDIEGPKVEKPENFNLQCRIYWVDGKATGCPSKTLIDAALAAAR